MILFNYMRCKSLFLFGDIAQLGERTTEVQIKNQIVRSLVRSRVAPLFLAFFYITKLVINKYKGLLRTSLIK